MKRRILAGILLLVLLVPTTAQAAPRMVRVIPSIRFSGTTATCSVSVSGDSTKDKITLTAKLWQGTECIATWSDAGTGYLSFQNKQTVKSGKIYKLTADVTINGKALETVSSSGTCP